MGRFESETLKSKALAVNDVLSDYIRLHDVMIKSSNSFWSIFKPINFEGLSQEAHVLFEKIKGEEKGLEELETKGLDKVQKEFYECLCSYAESLKDTIYLLFVLFKALAEKGKGGKLSFQEHHKNNERYKDSIEKYMSYGERLNQLYSSL